MRCKQHPDMFTIINSSNGNSVVSLVLLLIKSDISFLSAVNMEAVNLICYGN